jgi:hypothetical protein
VGIIAVLPRLGSAQDRIGVKATSAPSNAVPGCSTAGPDLPLSCSPPIFRQAPNPLARGAAALPRRDLPRELPVELTAVIGHRLFGAAFAILRTFGRGRWYAMEPNHAIMPVVLDPSLTTRQVRQQASALLPGAYVRRLVFWRYFLLWQKPVET